MIRPDRRSVLGGGLALGLLGGCARGPLADLVDGRPPAEGGIGGTGIVGVVTGLGSIRVGGYRVATPPETPVADALRPLSVAMLNPGHSVTVEASGPPGDLVARSVRVTHPLIGRVDAVDEDERRLTVMGTRVDLEDGVISLAQEGLRVAVSGLWDGDRVVASRIDVPLPAGPEVVAGVVSGTPADPRIGSLRLVARGGAVLPEPGRFATVLGERRENYLIATTVEAGRFGGAAGRLSALVVEGYLEPSGRPAPAFAISGLGHSFAPDVQVGPLAGQRAVYAGPYDGDFGAEVALVLPDTPAERADLLSRIAPAPGVEGAVVTR